jgi:hypothetical protein
MGGIFINKKLFFIGKKSSPHHPITPSPHQPRQFLTENETALPISGDQHLRLIAVFERVKEFQVPNS